MKMKSRPEATHYGQNYIHEDYLFFPKKLGDEWRWLEWAKWKSVVIYMVVYPGCSPIGLMWKETEWVK